MAYIFLFLSAFGAATLLPLQSESVLAGMLILGEYSPVLLIGVAMMCADKNGSFHLVN